MLRITITDTKTNETIFETFAKCICAGISVDDDQSRCVFYQQSNGISRKDAGHCLHAVDSVRRWLLKSKEIERNQKKSKEIKIAYWMTKLFSEKESEVVK